MNPIVFSAAFGALKGAFLTPGRSRDPEHSFQANVVAPVYEEALYRAVPGTLGGPFFVNGLSALVFAADHVIPELKEGLEGHHAVWRFADTFAGGLAYEAAYRRWGFLGAVLAHAAHNIMVGVGSSLMPLPVPVPLELQPAPHRLHRLPRIRRR